MTVAPVDAVVAVASSESLAGGPPVAATAPSTSFTQLLAAGLERVDQKVLDAEALAAAFALDGEAVPLHRVTYALEEARLSVELMMQVRARLLEGYQELMRMSL